MSSLVLLGVRFVGVASCHALGRPPDGIPAVPSLCVPLEDNFLKKIVLHGMDAVGGRPRGGKDAAPQANTGDPL